MSYTLQTYSSVVPVTAAGAYVAGDNIGGKLTFANCFVTAKMGGLLSAVMIADKAKQISNVDLVLFSENPAASTFTDNGAQAIAAADLLFVVAIVNITTHCSFSATSISYGTGLGESVYSTCGGALYGCLIARGTPTYASASDLSVRLDILQD